VARCGPVPHGHGARCTQHSPRHSGRAGRCYPCCCGRAQPHHNLCSHCSCPPCATACAAAHILPPLPLPTSSLQALRHGCNAQRWPLRRIAVATAAHDGTAQWSCTTTRKVAATWLPGAATRARGASGHAQRRASPLHAAWRRLATHCSDIHCESHRRSTPCGIVRISIALGLIVDSSNETSQRR